MLFNVRSGKPKILTDSKTPCDKLHEITEPHMILVAPSLNVTTELIIYNLPI
jgi:hypothetical protein